MKAAGEGCKRGSEGRWGGVLEGTYFKGIPILGGYLLSNSITDGVKEEKL